MFWGLVTDRSRYRQSKQWQHTDYCVATYLCPSTPVSAQLYVGHWKGQVYENSIKSKAPRGNGYMLASVRLQIGSRGFNGPSGCVYCARSSKWKIQLVEKTCCCNSRKRYFLATVARFVIQPLLKFRPHLEYSQLHEIASYVDLLWNLQTPKLNPEKRKHAYRVFPIAESFDWLGFCGCLNADDKDGSAYLKPS